MNRDAWGIESGLHQRLDVSHNDDRCRVRNDNAMLVLGVMLRLSNNLFMQWRGTSDAQTMSLQATSNLSCPKTTVRHSA
jgi:predicted transposase YbfD/YdcC